MTSMSSNPLQTLNSLSTRWQSRKQTSSLPYRLGMRLLEVIALAGLMFIVPTGIHRIVQGVDEVYELLGRRARSPYAASSSWISVLVAVILLVGWHVWLGRLSYKTVVEDAKGKGRKTLWGRILGRIVMPLLLLSFGVHLGYQLFARIVNPAPVVKGNFHDGDGLQRE